MVDLPKGVLRVSQRLTVIVGRALQTTTCRMVILHVLSVPLVIQAPLDPQTLLSVQIAAV